MVRPRLLIVERWKVIGELLVAILQQNGYGALTCFSGQKAIEICGSYCPDVAIIELIFDDMPGVELANRLRRSAPKRGFILYGGVEDMVNGYNAKVGSAPVFLVLQKAVQPQALLAELRRLLAGGPPEFEACFDFRISYRCSEYDSLRFIGATACSSGYSMHRLFC